MSIYAPDHMSTSPSDNDNQKLIMDMTVSRFQTVLFRPLLSDNQNERAKQLDKIIDVVKNWAKDCYSSDISSESQEPSPPCATIDSSKRSSMSDGSITVNHPASLTSSPIFTDDTTSGSVSSYVVSPNAGGNVTSIINLATALSGDLTSFDTVLSDDVFMSKDSPNYSVQRNDCIPRRCSLDPDNYDGNTEKALKHHIYTILRMSIDCPFDDVRRTFRKFLIDLWAMGVQVPAPIYPYPSYFIPAEEIVSLKWSSEQYPSLSTTPSPSSHPSSDDRISSSNISTTSSPYTFIGRQPDEPVKRLILETFASTGRISHLYRILSYFPSFMEKYQESFYKIVEDVSGPVKVVERLYIGIMAASQHKCQYLVSLFKHDFINQNGDTRWLEGLQYTSEKIKSLARLNTILAHRPWDLRPSHIDELIKCANNPNGYWKRSDVIHVILVLATFHSLSSFVMGCGIVPEYDTKGGNYMPSELTPGLFGCDDSDSSFGILDSNEKIRSDVAAGLGVVIPDAPINTTSDPISNNDEHSLLIQHNQHNQHNQTSIVDDENTLDTIQLIERLKSKRESSASTNEEESKDIENIKVEETPKHDSPNVTANSLSRDETETTTNFMKNNITTPPPGANVTEDFSLYLDPTIETLYSDFPVESSLFKLHEYCWEDHGVEMVSNPLPGVGELLDQEFNTTPLRQAIWFYVLRLFGLFKDDYSYENVDYLLNNKFKAYIRKLCCTPEDITNDDWLDMGFEFSSEDKCHVNLIAVEARKQAELVYGLWNVMKWRSREDSE
ncbi:785_t:CDS:2 [Gigaspora margarita]|uniref:785_t:CDS:1 n=1 Tax=Gigaspora margarita TaxID=4874 RepID=A0ABM8VYA3_GIGMA|nr:785_t:CDS:2 [Gigaspora margarita]